MIGERLALIYAQMHPDAFRKFVGMHAAERAEDADDLVYWNQIARELLESAFCHGVPLEAVTACRTGPEGKRTPAADSRCPEDALAMNDPKQQAGRDLRARLLELDPGLGRAIRMNREQIDLLTQRQAEQLEESYRLIQAFTGRVPEDRQESTRRFMLTRLLWDIAGFNPDSQAVYRQAVARFIGSRPDAVRAFFSERGVDCEPVLGWARETQAQHEDLRDAVQRIINACPSGESSC